MRTATEKYLPFPFRDTQVKMETFVMILHMETRKNPSKQTTTKIQTKPNQQTPKNLTEAQTNKHEQTPTKNTQTQPTKQHKPPICQNSFYRSLRRLTFKWED